MAPRFRTACVTGSQLLCTIVAAVTALLVSTAADGAEYTYTVIAETGPQFRFLGAPVLNNQGVVAFRGRFQDEGEGVFTGMGGPLTTVADTFGSFSSLRYDPSINDVGTVAFKAGLRSGELVIVAGSGLGGGSGFTTIADASGPIRFVNDFTSINNRGMVAFQALLDSGGRGVFTGSGGPITTIADTSLPFNDFTTAPSINNAGTVAFLATRNFPPGGQAIYVGNGGTPTLLADTSGPIFAFGQFSPINDSGAVAIHAVLDDPREGVIYAAANGTLTPLVSTAGPYGIIDNFPSFNRHGQVAFEARLDLGVDGIFTGPDPAADKVIQVGAALDGSVVTALYFSYQSFNDAGQLAFLADLADERRVVVRADVIPEPAHAGALIVAIVSTRLRCVRQRRAKRSDP